MAHAFCGSRISENIARDNAGALICFGVPICRAGWQSYRGSELGMDTDDVVQVYRDDCEVLSAATIASANGKVVTDNHPPQFVSPGNAGYYERGHVQNVREGRPTPEGDRTLIADLVIFDASLQSKIENGTAREISLGYDTEYEPQQDGTFAQKQIRINHCAVVHSARGGPSLRIRDAQLQDSFDAAARRYHRRNPIEVASERKAHAVNPLRSMSPRDMRREAAKIVENLPRGLFDEMEATNGVRRNEDDEEKPVAKRNDDSVLHEKIDRALMLINECLEISGKESDELIPTSDAGSRAAVEDSELRRHWNGVGSPERDFGEQARRYHRRSVQGPDDDDLRRKPLGVACDADEPETFEQVCRRRRRELLDRK